MVSPSLLGKSGSYAREYSWKKTIQIQLTDNRSSWNECPKNKWLIFSELVTRKFLQIRFPIQFLHIIFDSEIVRFLESLWGRILIDWRKLKTRWVYTVVKNPYLLRKVFFWNFSCNFYREFMFKISFAFSYLNFSNPKLQVLVAQSKNLTEIKSKMWAN